MERTKESVLAELATLKNPAKLSGSEFEKIVFRHTEKNAIGTPFQNKLRHTKDREFPDIVDGDYYGIEVKATEKDNWTSIGNSVLESSRDVSTRHIYIFFGKLGGQPDIQFRNYEDCLKGIAVTHYPRYQIDMQLQDGNSIFHKMGVSYDEIKDSDNPVKPIRNYYKSLTREGEALWWMDDDGEGSTTTAPIIKSLSSLKGEERNRLIADIYIRFPSILGNGSKKFIEVAAYLVTEYSIVSSSLRDSFTAGGVVSLEYRDKQFIVPQIALRMLELAPYINEQLINFDGESPLTTWLEIIDAKSAYMQLPFALSELFNARLMHQLDLPMPQR